MPTHIAVVAITLSGDVIGVGMRRAINRLASKRDVSGWVTNIRSAVEIVAFGSPQEVCSFICDIQSKPLPGAYRRTNVRFLELGSYEPASGFSTIGKIEHMARMSELEFGSEDHAKRAVRALDRTSTIQTDVMVRRTRAAKGGTRQFLLDELLSRNFAPDAIMRHARDLSGISSFRRCLYMRSRRNQIVPDDYTAPLNKKEAMHWLADRIGVPRAKTTPTFPLAHLAEARATAEREIGRKVFLKPAHSFASTGVYLCEGERFHSIGRSKVIEGSDALQAALQEDIASGKVRGDRWYFEQPIFGANGGPAHDVKFYAFYGEIGVVMEVERYPEKVYCWWSENGSYIRPGPYRQYYRRKLDGFTPEEAQIARELSLQLPVPFMRLDFLRDANGKLYFGEFGTRPGYFSKMDSATDRVLGEKYLAAEGRLMADLLNGKSFDVFSEFRKEFAAN